MVTADSGETAEGQTSRGGDEPIGVPVGGGNDAAPPAPVMVGAAEGDLRSLLSPRKLATQIVIFLIGLALLVWCIHGAVEGADWGPVRDASPWLKIGLLVPSLVSLVANGLAFWAVIRPVQRVGVGEMIWLNLTTAVLNYAPIRLGLLARLAYNLRVNGMGILLIGGWFGSLAVTMLTCLAASVLATIVRPEMDLLWLALLGGQLVVAGLVIRTLMSQTIIVRHARRMDLMLRDPVALWSVLGLRMLDIGAFVARTAIAVEILGLPFEGREVALLGISAITLSVMPLARVGFREAGLAIVARMLVSGGTTEELDAQMKQLALVESAGEALVAIPLGSIALIWYARQWMRVRRRTTADPASGEVVAPTTGA